MSSETLTEARGANNSEKVLLGADRQRIAIMLSFQFDCSSQAGSLSKNSFLLIKWYLDCVAENGDTVVLYAADLRWNSLSLGYANLLTAINGSITSAFSLHGITEPTISGLALTIKQPKLRVEGSWHALRNPIRRTVFQNPQGDIDWHCVQPMSQVELQSRGNRMSGLGYAECLTVSLLPWQLPLTQLNWGRYLSREDALVWIDWQGPEPRRHVIHNGEECQVTSVTESELVFAVGAGSLELDRGLTLRSGRLGGTIFPGISRLAGLVPPSMLAVEECKWRSRGILRNAASENSGWAIHEVVKWRE